MVTCILMFEHADGRVEHLTSQVPPDGKLLPTLLCWAGQLWQRSEGVGVYRLASVWVPDREEFTSTMLDEEDIEAMRIREAQIAIAGAKMTATEIATKIAEEVGDVGVRFDERTFRDAMKQGWWVACIKIIQEINGSAPKFADRRVDQLPIEQHVDWARIACFAFEAYNSVGEKAWMTFDGRPVPRWPALTDEVREKWTAAVKACVLDEQRRKMEAVNECEIALRFAARDHERIRVLREALRDLLVLVGEKPIADLPPGTPLAGCIERAKKALASP